MEQDGYQIVTDIEEIRQYVETVGGFSGFALGNLQFDSSGLAFSIEEVIDGEDWPHENSGRIWYLAFSRISNISMTIDMSLGFWIKNVQIDDGGSVNIESDQGAITLIADAIELSVPSDAVIEQPSEDALPPLMYSPDGGGITTGDESVEPIAPSEPIATVEPINNPTPQAAPASQPLATNQEASGEIDDHTETIQMTPSTTSPAENPFLNDPNFIPLTPVTPTAPPKAPEPPVANAIFSN
ncbi:MAG: hypothetical protein K5837_04590 [Candidatus Saccharibacteria bacterium]|nr:hypothetical protein [Candidatus Saccharibacteria bacterium]